MSVRFSFASMLLILALVSTADATDNRHMLFAGHSFFHPVASKLEHAVEVLGIEGHSQQVIVAGGKTGSPEALWFGDYADQMKEALVTGEIDLLGLTVYTEETSGIDDYRRWVDYALEANPDTDFFIGLPWGQYPETKTLSEYEAENKKFETLLVGMIEQLEAEYPETEFLLLNYGRGAIELRRMLEAAELPGTTLMGDRNSAIYTDEIGHAGNALGELSVWLWVPALFKDVALSARDVSERPLAKLAERLSAQ